MYNKLFSKIVRSSIWLEPTPTRLVWVMFIAIMDEDGFVNLTAIGNVAHEARITLDEATEAIRILESPDENSADQEHEGRRIERVPGGWLMLNASKYRDLVTRDIARQQVRDRVAKHRAKKRKGNASVTPCNDPVTQSEAEVQSKEKKKKEPPSLREIEDFCQRIGLPKSDAEAMLLHWTERKWPKSWQLTIRKWKSFGYMPSQKQRNGRITKLPAPSGPAYKRVDPAPPEMSDEEFARQQKIVRDGCAQFKKTMRHE